MLGQGAPIVGTARVTLVASPLPGVVGTTLNVRLRIDLSGVTGVSPAGATVPAVLGGYQVRVAFDKTLLRFDSASGGTATGYAAAPVTTDPAIANANGSVTLTAAQTGAYAPTGLVHVAVLSFQVLDHGAAALSPSPLSLSTALQPGPPDVGLVAIPGAGVVSTVPLDVVSGALSPQAIQIDPPGGVSGNGNGVLEPGEQATAAPAWRNVSGSTLSVTGAAQGFSGPAGATYVPVDAGAAYGSIGAGSTSDCLDATGNCYGLSVSLPSSRPSAHWDAYFTESPSTGDIKTWTLHVGKSFTDVPTSYLFYKGIETIFHNGVTGGCGTGTYCPGQAVTRAQMAVFLLKSRYGSSYVPPLPSGTLFTDVPPASFAAGWIEDMASRGITGGCGGGKFCPGSSVTRGSMAVLLLRTEHGSAYTPPAATGMFSDVPVSDPFAKWIEQLAREGVTGGCGGGKYCPGDAVTRGQMAAFLSKTFKLSL
ncbi:MAG: cohesin domain-containing protein [Acidobacteriota bacterium]